MKNDRVLRIVVWVALAVLVLIYILDPTKGMTDPTARQLAKSTVLRAAAIPVLACCALILRVRLFAPPHVRHLALLLPALAIAVDNFPWIEALTGSATLTGGNLIGWIVLSVLCIGIMEELAFRGILLPLLLSRFGKTKRGMFQSVVLSSVIFGLVHLLNLIEGAGVVPTLLQVGYSMLTGAMLAVLLLGTGNIVGCIAVHAVFNFGGAAVEYLAEGQVWTVPAIVTTVVLSIFVAAWMIVSFCRMDPQKISFFDDTPRKKTTEEGD